jgi:hypothetical protein
VISDIGVRAARGEPPAAAAPPSITASNFKPVGKNSLRATADVVIPKWRLRIRGVMWHQKNGKDWIAFPSREWLDKNGERQFSVLLEFTDKNTERRFKDSTLAAMRALAGRQGE